MPQEMKYFTQDEVKEMEQPVMENAAQTKTNHSDSRQKNKKNKRNHQSIVWLLVLLVIAIFVVSVAILTTKGKGTQATLQETNNSQMVASEAQSTDDAANSAQTVVAGPQVSKEDWFMVLASPGNPLPDGFDPETEMIDNAGYYLDSRAAEDFFAMEEAATQAGLQLKVISGFRSANRQQALYDAEVQRLLNTGLTRQEAESQAQRIEQKQYESDHNTGLAVDLVPTYKQTKDVAVITQLPEYQWLVEHAAEYGFILRYPQDKEEVTGVEFKPWHWRYVGKEMAVFLKENNMTLDEYWQTYFA